MNKNAPQNDKLPTHKILRSIIRALVKFCAKHSFKIQEVTDCLREEYLQHAQNILNESGEKVTQSRLSVISGISRREVDKALQGKAITNTTPSILSRIISRWRDDSRFCTSTGTPKVLTIDAENGEFNKLVASISRDVGPATMLFELERLKYAERVELERKASSKKELGLKLLVDNYIPRGATKVNELSEILSLDLLDLTDTVHHNIFEGERKPHHHLRTVYDKVRKEDLEHLRAWFLREGHDFHLRAREEIAKFDQDVNPKEEFDGATVKIGFSSFSTIDMTTNEGKKDVSKQK